MKALRRTMAGIGAVAGILLVTQKIGTAPICPGYDLKFAVRTLPTKVELKADADGDMKCWLELMVPVTSGELKAQTSTGIPLHVYDEARESRNPAERWVAVVKGAPEEKFEWPSGGLVTLSTVSAPESNLVIADWYVNPSDKSYDSQSRAKWRRWFFRISAGLLGISLIYSFFAAFGEPKSESKAFGRQACIEGMIVRMEGADEKETEWMQGLLTKVLIEDATAESAVVSVPLPRVLQLKLWFKTSKEFRTRLEKLIVQLFVDLDKLKPGDE